MKRGFIALLLSMMILPPVMAAGRHKGHNEYRPGEVIVKFKAETTVKVKQTSKGKFSSVNVSAVNKLLKSVDAEEMTQLMPLTGKTISKKRMMSYYGHEVKDMDLSQLYCVKFDTKASLTVPELVSQLEVLDEVEFAEPNYLVYTMDGDSAYDDPYYSQQWGLQAIRMPETLQASTNVIGRRPVIAILDTGVDTTHPDLAANIWTNSLENQGSEGYDDDGNGFTDDIHGWDFVNQTGRIGDWNGHGTHCAGLAAAEGNNGKGIVGANPDALIMSVTVMQSDGVGDVATIVKGVDYAFANGADVISMSIGSYTHSIAEELALGKAYAKCVLVAAAGNDCLPINPTTKCPYCGEYGAPCYPAAFTFVLGVQATSSAYGSRASFSNYDDDGPIYSQFSEEKLYNYEVSAPGTSMISTYPGGKYKSLQGTSMACPLVAGAVSRLISCKEILSKEILFGDLIHTASGNVDIKAAFDLTDEDRKPTLSLITYEMADDDETDDNDGRPDAGEIIKIHPTLRNDWGQANNVKVSVCMGENEDSSLVEFITAEADLGHTLSSYAKAKSENPLVVRLSERIVDGRHLKLCIKATCDNASEETSQEIVLNVENGVELQGTQRENITLYPNVHYIVTRNWGIPKDVTVTIKPGTVIKIKDGVGISNYGFMLFEGTADSLITITKGDNDIGNIGGFLNDNANYSNFKYVKFDNLAGITFNGHRYDNCIISNCYITNSFYFSSGAIFNGCDIYNNQITYPYGCWLSDGSTFLNCNVHGNEITSGFGSVARFYHSNYIGNTILYGTSTPGPKDLDESNCYGNFYDQLNDYHSIIYNTTEPEIAYMSKAYLGTADPEIAKVTILDEADNVGWGTVDVTDMLYEANTTAPGCVDYVLVDGYDPLDEADLLPPLGVGRHKVEVNFNKAMDTSSEPSISMGVRTPYTQKSISEDGQWKSPLKYEAYITIDGKSATDGLNRLRVYGFKQNDSDFELPEERYRYNVYVEAAGSMSTGMMAEAGLGKVTLTWETAEEDFEDLLGYNIYRFTRNGDVSSDSVIINDGLIDSEETGFVDYDVVPGTTYYYFIKEMGTDLSQNSISKTVAATPLTAKRGDANGSMEVDIADVMTEIAYLSNENPQPFIFEAADVNSDGYVDILDVVGTLQLITNPDFNTQYVEEQETAYYYVENGKLFIDTPVALGGLQIRLAAEEGEEFTACKSLSGLELLNAQIRADERLVLAYSLSGKVIPVGEDAMLEIDDISRIKEIVLSTPRGANVLAEYKAPTRVETIQESKTAETQGQIYDLTGRRISAAAKGVYIVNGKKTLKK